ncbi:MAG: DUF402 domain-containing protein [Bacilli bacterium]
MKNMKIGDNYTIHCYKHDGTIHRSWDEAILLDVNKDYLVFGNSKAKVNNCDGRIWYTKEPAIIYYYKDKWYNVITQFKEKGIYYYCNIATPTILEGKYIKYIDYDLDLRVFPDDSYKILDESEYEYHRKKMNYPDEVDFIVKKELKNLIAAYEKKDGPFNKDEDKKYYDKYMLIIGNK